MFGRSNSLGKHKFESPDLRKALYEPKKEVQRLQKELDAEREAAATSASEAMAMILRLQGEKAALAMEASQYKRMNEERMFYAELSFELLEDLNYHKEVEIKNLESCLYGYRCKLLSLECSEIDADCDRFQTPSPDPYVLVPVEKGVIQQSMNSRRDIVAKEKANCLLVKNISKKSKQRKERRSVKRDLANDAEYQAELQRLKERVEWIERERCNTDPQISGIKQEDMNLQRKSKEELSYEQSGIKNLETTKKLLPSNESGILAVQEQEDMMNLHRESESYVQSEIKNLGTTKKLLRSDNSSIVSVQEAMLYFWL